MKRKKVLDHEKLTTIIEPKLADSTIKDSKSKPGASGQSSKDTSLIEAEYQAAKSKLIGFFKPKHD